MLSTLHQRNIESFFHKKKQSSLSELKSVFVDSGEMNSTTLYRILDRWKSEGIVHELTLDKDRIFLHCPHPHKDEGVRISCCTNCHEVAEAHFPLPTNTLRAENIEYLKSCNHCHHVT